MRSHGVATILLMIPVLTIPALAIFGIPQFAPVVASPLEEEGQNDRERRVGHSARSPHDELFEDVEGFGADQGLDREGPLRKRSSSNSTNTKSRPPRDQLASTAGWGDDLQRVPEQPRRSRSSSPTDDGRTNLSTSEVLGENREIKYERKRRNSGNSADAPSGPLNDSSNNLIQQIGYSEEAPEQEPQRNPAPRNSVDPRDSQSREFNKDEVTWGAAVERLNQLDIRSFRLEPGSRTGLFVFICSYTPAENSSVSYRFEAEADQPLKAVQKVLDQVIEWQQRR
jgi:hypothetical protein